MELSQAISSRRSIREYESKAVSQEDIATIIEAAKLAPSWKNRQTTRYNVITSQECLEKIKSCLPERNANNIKNAGAVIVVSFVKNLAGFDKNGLADNELGNGWGIYDAGLATQNLLLKACELGLGTLVMGIRDAVKIKDLLSLNDNEDVISVIGLGYHNVNPTMPERKNLAEIMRIY